MAVITGVDVDGSDFGDRPEEMNDVRVSPQMGGAALAMNFALKYHDLTTIQEGSLYQQYKLEGRNMRELHLDDVIYTATQIEKHLLFAPNRLALAVLEMASQDVLGAIDEASGIETEGGNEVPSPGDESPTPQGDAQHD